MNLIKYLIKHNLTKFIYVVTLMIAVVFAFACGEKNPEPDEPVTGEDVFYNITFYLDETKKVYLEEEVKEGEKVNKPTAPEKEYFIFENWYLYETDSVYDFETPVTNNLELVAKWTEEEFTDDFVDVTLISDGEKIGEICLDLGDPIQNLAERFTLTKYGYDFAGWYNGEELVTNGYVPKRHMVLEAKWIPQGTIYTLTLDGEVREFLEGDTYTLPVKNKKGETLIGYADKNGEVVNGVITMDQSYEFTSVWIKNGSEGSQYSLKLEDDKDYKVEYGKEVILPQVFKYGYEFLGWTDGVYNYSKGFSFKVVNNVTLKPIYKAHEQGDNFSKVAYTIYNIDTYVASLQFPLKNDVTLPVKDDITGATISWESNYSEVLSNDGKVNRIFHKDRNIEVDMTATITYEGISEKVNYLFTVKQSYRDLSNGIAAGYLYPADGISSLGLSTLDIIYCAFLYFDASGEITSGSSYVNNMRFLNDAHAGGTRVVASIGAQNTNTLSYIATISKNDTLIKKFAENLLAYVVEYKLDGIDMDWETPGSANAKNYTRLMKVIYQTFKAYDEELLVTSAIGAGPWQYNYYDLNNSAQYHDYINMMSYDMQSGSKCSFQNALYPSNNGYLLTNQCSVSETVKLYNSVSIPNEKIIVGMPFYGRTFTSAEGVGKNGTHSGAINQATIKDYITRYGSGVEFWDDQCKVPYIYIESEKRFVTYENPRSIYEKMKFVGENNLAGVMFWQNGQDNNGYLMQAIKDNKGIL